MKKLTMDNATFENCFGVRQTETMIDGIVQENTQYIIDTDDTVAEYLLDELRIHSYLTEAGSDLVHDFPENEGKIAEMLVDYINENYNYNYTV